MTKLATAEGFFDDGLTYLFGEEIKPRHVHIEVQTNDNQLETCDLRLNTINPVPVETTDAAVTESTETESNEIVLTSSPVGPDGYAKQPDSDVIFFRMGYFNFMKLNSDAMVHETAADTWYTVDMLIDWDNQKVSIYVDG